MIKMIAGVYGMSIRRADGSIGVKGIGPDDGSFSLTPERERELVEKGVARYVESVESMKPFGEMTAKELREVGKKYGVTLRVGLTKAEMVAAIKAKLVGDDAEDDADKSDDSADNVNTKNESDPSEDNDDEPEEDGETEDDAPTFDATEAVN